MKYTDFQEDIRRVVLDSLDGYAGRKRFGHGWKDEDLSALFAGVDTHARVLASRINDTPGLEEIDMED
jgi:hypothetical protein